MAKPYHSLHRHLGPTEKGEEPKREWINLTHVESFHLNPLDKVLLLKCQRLEGA